MRSLSLLLFALASLCSAQNQTATARNQAAGASNITDKPASVEGIVTNTTTGAPIADAHVMIRMFFENGARNQVYGSTSNADGKYTISGLPAGQFYAFVELPGYIMPAERNRNGASGSLSAGDKKEIKLKLQPAGQIVGRVVDEDGNPALAEVSADNGTTQQFRAGTDEKGQFRIGGLLPGKYKVRAKPVGDILSMPAEIRSDGSIETFELTTWFPGVTDRKSAARVTVGAGSDASGVDIRLVRSRVNYISGKVVGIPAGMQRTFAAIREETGGTRQASLLKPDGTFTIWRVDPGKLRLVAWGSAGTYVESAPLDLELGDRSLENLELRFVDKADVPGQLNYEDDEAKPSPAKAKTNAPAVTGRVALQSTFGFGSFSAPIQDDGTFTLKGVPPNRYRVSLSWSTAYVRSVRLGNVELDKPEIDLSSGAAGATLSLKISSGVAEISGTVTDSKGPAAGVRVVLGPRQKGPFTSNTSIVTGPDGVYKFTRVVPGNYNLYAVDDDDLTYVGGTPDNYEDVLVEVEVKDRDKLTRDLKRHGN